MKSLIYDYETLSNDFFNGVVVNLASLHFEESRFIDNPYEYEELLGSAKFIKFDVLEQVETYNRKISKDTLAWWGKLPDDVQLQLKPSSMDVSISTIYDHFTNTLNVKNCKRVYTRGNTFDPILTVSLHKSIDRVDPTPFWNIRDTRSLFEGMTYGHNIKHNFIPEGLESKFKAHDPIHDIAMDVMRFQYLARVLMV
jgi:hypothetical protein